MQYLAILDAEELIFLDGNTKCWIDIAWRKFHPQQRTSLGDSVPYDAVFYHAHAVELMPRLLAELPRALREQVRKVHPDGSAQVIKFPAPG
jgi:hypothetical protein